jgi:sulfoxide reductase heme-binding subunit YedZ
MERSPRIGGWPFVGWCALALIGLFAAVLAWDGTGEAGVRAVVRHSAQTSLILFSAAFMASSLALLSPSKVTRWMLVNRRYLGVSFAVSHLLHLMALIALARVSAAFVASLNAAAIVGGGIAYVFIAAMVATSFDRTAARLGPRAWRRLHTVGMYYIWVIFLQSYLPRAAAAPAYLPAAGILLLAIGVRLAARMRVRRHAAAPAAARRVVG